MKDPKTLFPFLFASSWAGNFFLTVLAFYLAFTHDGPLSPTIFLTVAICILSGNILPIAVYWLLITWREAELKAEGLEASVRVRDALRRSEDIMGRLDETEGSLAKAILVSRQVPERIRESFDELLAIASKLDTMEISSFTESLSRQSESIKSVEGEIGNNAKVLQQLDKDLKGIPKALEKILEEIRPETPSQMEELDSSTGERLDMLFESMESIQDSIDSLLGRIAELDSAMKSVRPEKAVKNPSDKAKSGKTASTANTPDAPQQKSLGLDSSSTTSFRQSNPVNSDQVRLVAHAMVGINNKLFVRGDEPWLSWDEGTPMDLVGIGEFAWVADDVKDPIEISIRLNDEMEALGGIVKLEPGKTIEISPKFTE